jgi:hypothetical protein
MKKILVLAVFLVTAMSAEAQIVKFGIKGGANFAKLDGDNIDSKMITSFHAGIAAEIKALPILAIQPELLYSSQGAKVEGQDDIKLDYVSVPVLAKFYILPSILSLDAGPQFSFLVSDNLDSAVESKSFDMAIAGGLGVNLGKHLFGQARYVVGLTETTKDSGVKNNVFQLSVGYFF